MTQYKPDGTHTRRYGKRTAPTRRDPQVFPDLTQDEAAEAARTAAAVQSAKRREYAHHDNRASRRSGRGRPEPL
jgi:hypothetical protein